MDTGLSARRSPPPLSHTALLTVPGVGGLVRVVASYAAVFVAFFVLVTILTSLR
jgi:hypothetical protein